MKELEKKIEDLISSNANDIEIAKLLKDDIKNYFQTLPDTFAQTGGKAFLVKHTDKIDTIIQMIYKITLRTMFGEYPPMKNQLPLAILALGSYGREQLCVYSDIDIMFAYEDVPGYQMPNIIEKMLYMLWDIGLKLGHRVHIIDELPEVTQSDITIKSAILESRFIEGSRSLLAKVENKINIIRRERPEEFIRAKIDEQRALHQKYPLSMEPNIKEGVGGFRDANLVFWMGKLLYNVPRIKDLPSNIINEEDYRRYRMAIEFLFRVRSALHLIAGKKDDTLRLEYIPQLSQMLGFGDTSHQHMRLAKKVTESLRVIYLYSKIWFEKLVSDRVDGLYDGLLLIDDKVGNLRKVIKLLSTNADKPYKVHPKTLSAILHAKRAEKIDEKFYRTVSNIFHQNSAYSVLKSLHTAQLLIYAVPSLKKVANLPQFDGYHQFSVDIHSLYALWYLENITDESLQEKYYRLNKNQKHLLKLATLLHDAGKGRKKPHAIVGVSLFRIYAKKLGLKSECIDLGAHLILYHDVMSRTAQREDLYNEKTILRFASLFDTQTKLDLIHLLTYADMSAVGPGVYTEHSARLLKTLYNEAFQVLHNKTLLNNTARRLQKIEKLSRSRYFADLTTKEKKKLTTIPSNEFFIDYSSKDIIDISKWATGDYDYKIRINTKPTLSIEIVRRIPLDLGYLLAKLSRLNIQKMDIYKLFDGVKFFKIVFSDEIDESEIDTIKLTIDKAFGEHDPVVLQKPSIGKKEIEIDCNHSKEYAAMRLHTKDQKGLLAYITQLFEKLHIDIASTKIHTRKHYVNDLFLIEKDGNFCHNVNNIIKELTE